MIAASGEKNSGLLPRLRVLLLAYSISPLRGSEYSVGWNHVKHMSQYCDLTVLYGLAGPHMGDIEDIEDYLHQEGELKNVRFVAVRPSIAARTLNFLNRRGFLVYTFYIAYRVWHWQAARKAKAMFATDHFDLVHYLCPIGYREPGFLWRLEVPYVWGPVGGMARTRILIGAPRSWLSVWKTRLKNLVNASQLTLSHRVAKALIRSDKLVAATSENAEIIKKRFGIDAQIVPENAIPDEWIESKEVGTQPIVWSPVRLIWIGSLDGRKSPDLLVDAMKKVSTNDWHLNIVGEGPLGEKLKTMIIDAALESKITLHGLIPRSQVHNLMSLSDLHIITSMSEGNPTVIWEAMASGVPTLSLEHCGMRDTICDTCGVLIPLSDYHETRDAIATHLDRLIRSPKELASKKAGTLACAQKHLWDRRAKVWLEVYDEAIKRYAGKKTGSKL